MFRARPPANHLHCQLYFPPVVSVNVKSCTNHIARFVCFILFLMGLLYLLLLLFSFLYTKNTFSRFSLF